MAQQKNRFCLFDDIKARLADETKTRLVAIDEIKVQLAALTEARVAMN